MTEHTARARHFAFAAIAASALVACSLFRTSLVEQGVVVVDRQGGANVSVRDVDAYPSDGGIEVSGSVTSSWSVPITGHIDLTVVRPDGPKVVTPGVPLEKVFSYRRLGRRSIFEVSVASIPPPGTVLVVIYHEGSHMAESSSGS